MFVGDFNIKITVVAAVGPAAQCALNNFTFADRESLVEVKDGLFPMRVFCVRSS